VLPKQRLAEPAGQEDGRHLMTIHDTSFPDILNVAALRAKCSFIASAHAEHRDMMRRALLAAFKQANLDGRQAARELLKQDGSGLRCAERISWLQDQLITVLHDFVLNEVFDAANAQPSTRIAVTAVGGYGRGTLAPGSDIDLLFLLPAKKAVWAEPAIEFMLYILWDLGFKVGHATRTIDECIRLARGDMTIRTAILETRYICGSRDRRRARNPLRQRDRQEHGSRFHRRQARRARRAPPQGR